MLMFLDLNFIFQPGLLKRDELIIVFSKLNIFLMEERQRRKVVGQERGEELLPAGHM